MRDQNSTRLYTILLNRHWIICIVKYYELLGNYINLRVSGGCIHGLHHSPFTNLNPHAELLFACLGDSLNFKYCFNFNDKCILCSSSLYTQVFCEKRAVSLKEKPQNSAGLVINQSGLSTCRNFTDLVIINA